jgi:hypothetical protein
VRLDLTKHNRNICVLQAQLAGNAIIRKEFNVRPTQHSFEEHLFWKKTTMTVNGGTLSEADVSILQKLLVKRTKDLGAQLTLVPNSRGGPQKPRCSSPSQTQNTYYMIAQEKISVVSTLQSFSTTGESKNPCRPRQEPVPWATSHKVFSWPRQYCLHINLLDQLCSLEQHQKEENETKIDCERSRIERISLPAIPVIMISQCTPIGQSRWCAKDARTKGEDALLPTLASSFQVLDRGKNWVLVPKRAELGPICDDPMALIIDGKNLPGYIGEADNIQALKMTGTASQKTTVELIVVDRRLFFLVQTYDAQFAARIWIGGLQMAYGKVVSVELTYLWKSDVLKSQIPGFPQDKAYDVVVKQNPRMLSNIKAARSALKGSGKGKASALSAVRSRSLSPIIFQERTCQLPLSLSHPYQADKLITGQAVNDYWGASATATRPNSMPQNPTEEGTPPWLAPQLWANTRERIANLENSLLTPLTLDEVSTFLKHTGKSAPGTVDRIQYDVLRSMCVGDNFKASKIDEVLLNFLNTVLRQKQMPDTMKNAMLTFIYKVGDPLQYGNYKGISLLSCLFKIITGTLNGRLQHILHNKAGLDTNQGANRKGVHAAHKAAVVIDIIADARAHQKPLHIIYADFKGAFPSVPFQAFHDALTTLGLITASWI